MHFKKYLKRGWKINHFCEIIRTTPQGVKGCLVSDAKGGSIARQNKSPYYYECQFGLTDIAFPIFIGNRFVTTIYMGRILAKPSTLEGFTFVKEKVKGMKIDLKELLSTTDPKICKNSLFPYRVKARISGKVGE